MFFIVWGFRSRVANLAMIQLACRNGHVAAHRLMKITRWFTLFFIPLIPVRHRYVSVCAQCGIRVAWGKEDAEAMAARARSGASVPITDPIAPPVLPTNQTGSGTANPSGVPSWPSGPSVPASNGWDLQTPGSSQG
jgi:hypothetical protein